MNQKLLILTVAIGFANLICPAAIHMDSKRVKIEQALQVQPTEAQIKGEFEEKLSSSLVQQKTHT